MGTDIKHKDGLTRSGTGCFIAVSIWQQWIHTAACCRSETYTYLERLVGNAVGVVGADATSVTVVDYQHHQCRQRSGCSRRDPCSDDAQSSSAVGDAGLSEQRAADG